MAGWPVEDLERAFVRRYGAPPKYVVRAPGRVNLIGEHTDYNSLPVLPFAIAQSHFIAAGPGDESLVRVSNLDGRYGDRSFPIEDLHEMGPAGDWANYIRAALIGFAGEYAPDWPHLEAGLNLLVTSDLPSGVGLSSSSALMVGTALAALAVTGRLHEVMGSEDGRLHLASTMADAERHVGTRGGGMDQTICIFGKAGHALKIDFTPFVQIEEAIPIPDDIAIFIADSGVRVEKSGEGRALYNQRPAECNLAVAVLRAWAESEGRWTERLSYLGSLIRPPFDLSHAEALKLVREALPEETYSRVDLPQMLPSPEHKLLNDPGERLGGFRLRQRAEHVLAEAWRVEEAAAALKARDRAQFAELVNESHASCRDLYEISHPELDRLVEAAIASGALASRLTGAGFGGCTLQVVEKDAADRFEREMTKRLKLDQRLFRVAPSPGAEVAGARAT